MHACEKIEVTFTFGYLQIEDELQRLILEAVAVVCILSLKKKSFSFNEGLNCNTATITLIVDMKEN